jgi:seryl-tRNA synthetase
MRLMQYFIAQVRSLIDAAVVQNEKDLAAEEALRNNALREVGNHLHDSVPVSDNEDNNRVEQTFGDCSVKQKYSHVDLIHMIDGKFLNVFRYDCSNISILTQLMFGIEYFLQEWTENEAQRSPEGAVII